MRIINQNIARQRNKTLNQFALNIQEGFNYASIGIVDKIEDRVWVRLIPSISYEDYNMKDGFKEVNTPNETISCLIVEGLDLVIDDVVLVLFTDLDSNIPVDQIRRGKNKKEPFNVPEGNYHNSNYGVIINKIAI